MALLHRPALILLLLLTALASPAMAQETSADVSPWASPESEPEITYLRMATGPSAGSAFSIGQKLSLALSNPPGARPCDEGGACGVENVIVVAAATNGSSANLRHLRLGIFDLVLAQDLNGHESVTGIGAFAALGPDTGLRALARIDAQYLYVMTRRGANMRNVGDLRGGIVSRGAMGSGIREFLPTWLSIAGLQANSMDLRGIGLDQAVNMMAADLLDALFVFATPQTPAVRELTGEGLARMQSLTASDTAKFARAMGPLRVVKMPASLSGQSNAAWWTVATDLVLFARSDMPDDQAEAIVQALWHDRNIALVRRGNAYDTIEHGGLMDPAFAIDGLSAPVHEGAMRFYWKQDLATDPDSAL